MKGFDGINRISTDGFGFRTSKDIDYLNKQRDIKRIFIIGASTSEQIYHDDKETWPAILEKNINKKNSDQYEIINTGVSGLRANNFLATLKYINKFKPDYVLFLTGVNDWNRHIINESKSLSKNKYLFRFNITKSPIFLALQKIKQIFNKNKFYNVTDTYKIYNEDGNFYSQRNNSFNKEKKINLNLYSVNKEYEVNFLKISNICNKEIFKCLFINQPVIYKKDISDEMLKKMWMTPPNQDFTLSLDNMISIASKYNNWLLEFGKKNNIISCDLAEKMNGIEKYFYDDVHFNEAGSVEAANFITLCFENLVTSNY